MCFVRHRFKMMLCDVADGGGIVFRNAIQKESHETRLGEPYRAYVLDVRLAFYPYYKKVKSLYNSSDELQTAPLVCPTANDVATSPVRNH